MPLARELSAAAALALGRAELVVDRASQEHLAALAWLGLAGLGVGGAAALLSATVGSTTSTGAALAGALALHFARGPVRRWPVALAAGGVEVGALLAMAPAARAVALVVAPMLARWAVVVQCYGGAPRAGATGLAGLAGRARFREFAIASVTTLGTMLVLLDAVGLAIAVACALVTLGVRTVSYRRTGGIGDGSLDATSALVETSALVLMASIGSALGAR